MSVSILIGIVVIYCLLLFFRLLYILPTTNPTPPSRRPPSSRTHLAIVLGSGGHTAEALRLLSTLNLHKFTHRTYIVSSGDALSAHKAVEFEREKGSKESSYTIKEIPRARRVGQSWFSTPESCARSFVACLWALAGDRPTGFWEDAHLIVCNGPGTAVMVVLASLVFKFVGLKCRTIYVESFARVKSLSLSGKILYRLVDRFIVQWPGLAKSYPRAEYHGVLV